MLFLFLLFILQCLANKHVHVCVYNDVIMLYRYAHRYAHCSVRRPSGEVIVYGGYGCSPDSGVHSRLDSVIGISICESGLKVRSIQLCSVDEISIGKVICFCMIHYATTILLLAVIVECYP